jgi:hypothetical protein
VTFNGTVGTWNLVPENLEKEACSRLPRNLNLEEWKTHIGSDIPYTKICPSLP